MAMNKEIRSLMYCSHRSGPNNGWGQDLKVLQLLLSREPLLNVILNLVKSQDKVRNTS